MPERCCRFCLDIENLIKVFGSKLVYAAQMLSLLMLCPAINHRKQSTGNLSKYVCLKCCRMAIKSFKYGIYSMLIDNNQSSEDLSQNEVQQNGAVVQKPAVPKKCQRPVTKKSTVDEPYKPGTGNKRVRKSKRISKRALNDSETDEVIPPKRNRSRISVDLKPETPQPDIQNDKTQFLGYLRLVSTVEVPEACSPTPGDESALVPVKSQPYCTFCKKTYSSEAYYKIHMKKHVRCYVCNNVFASDSVLQKHWGQVCGKTVIANQPTVVLEHVDQIAEIVEKHSEAFRAHFKPTSNEDVIIVLSSDDEEDPDEDVIYVGSYVLGAKIEAESNEF